METKTFTISISRTTDARFRAELFGINGDESGNLETALESLAHRLFQTRKQLTQLPGQFVNDAGRKLFTDLNAFLPKPSNSTNWE